MSQLLSADPETGGGHAGVLYPLAEAWEQRSQLHG